MESERIDIDEVFKKGGKPLIELLDYCVRSIQLDPVFIFLVQEYRYQPTGTKAIALYDAFCAPVALGRISVWKSLPPYNLSLIQAIQPFRANATLLPAKHLFDSLVAELERNSEALRQIRQAYNPRLKMTAAQRHFVDRIWQPIVRPRLASAGFWRVLTIA